MRGNLLVDPRAEQIDAREHLDATTRAGVDRDDRMTADRHHRAARVTGLDDVDRFVVERVAHERPASHDRGSLVRAPRERVAEQPYQSPDVPRSMSRIAASG
jgi:hypothetical protein